MNKTVYILSHQGYYPHHGHQTKSIIGIYASRESAQKEMDKINENKFVNLFSGFKYIEEREILP